MPFLVPLEMVANQIQQVSTMHVGLTSVLRRISPGIFDTSHTILFPRTVLGMFHDGMISDVGCLSVLDKGGGGGQVKQGTDRGCRWANKEVTRKRREEKKCDMAKNGNR